VDVWKKRPEAEMSYPAHYILQPNLSHLSLQRHLLTQSNLTT